MKRYRIVGLAAPRRPSPPRRSCSRRSAAKPVSEDGQGDPAAEMGDAGAVRRLLRRQLKGYEKQFGIDLTMKPGGPDIIPEQVVASGQASNT